MDKLIEMIPFLIPALIIQLALMIAALVHVLRHESYRVGSRVIWIVVVVVFQILGPVAYFIFGRGDE